MTSLVSKKQEVWEARRRLRYGSRHEAFFTNEKEALAFVKSKMKKDGYMNIVNRVIYYTDLPEDES